jgi:hypothetical protein
VCCQGLRDAPSHLAQRQLSNQHAALVVVERGADVLVKGEIAKMRMGIEAPNVLNQKSLQQFIGAGDLAAILELSGLQYRIAVEILRVCAGQV